jgi:hypothetical protein
MAPQTLRDEMMKAWEGPGRGAAPAAPAGGTYDMMKSAVERVMGKEPSVSQTVELIYDTVNSALGKMMLPGLFGPDRLLLQDKMDSIFRQVLSTRATATNFNVKVFCTQSKFAPLGNLLRSVQPGLPGRLPGVWQSIGEFFKALPPYVSKALSKLLRTIGRGVGYGLLWLLKAPFYLPG